MLALLRSPLRTSALALCALIAGCATPHVKAVRTSDRLQDFRVAVEDLQLKCTAASGSLTAVITRKDQDPKGALDAFDNDVDAVASAFKRAQSRLDSLNKQSEAYFDTWKEQAATLEDEDLKESSENRREALQAALEKVTKSFEPARTEAAAYLESLQDTLQYLGIDLTPQGISAAESKAKSTAKSSKGVCDELAEVLEAVKAAEPQFARAMPPQPVKQDGATTKKQ